MNILAVQHAAPKLNNLEARPSARRLIDDDTRCQILGRALGFFSGLHLGIRNQYHQKRQQPQTSAHAPLPEATGCPVKFIGGPGANVAYCSAHQYCRLNPKS